MFEVIASDVTGIFRETFLQGDWIALAIAFGSVFIVALMMRRGTQIGSMTLLALALFAVGCFLRGAFIGPEGASVTGGALMAQLETNWAHFMMMQAGTLLAYFVTFMLCIFILFALKSVIARG